MALDKERFADDRFAVRPLPSVTLGNTFAECNTGFTECHGHSAKGLSPVVLHELKFNNEDWGINNADTRLISDGIDLATMLLQVEETHMPELMELVFDVWIDKLLYAGTRCRRESHAKQLSHGAELSQLTSIVWIITEHAGPFRIGETIEGSPFPMIENHDPPPPPKKEEPAAPPPEKKEEPRKEKPPPPKKSPLILILILILLLLLLTRKKSLLLLLPL